jgi:SAM-dependent methyltransferase
MIDKSAVVEHYDRHASAMENLPEFYDWLTNVFKSCSVPAGAVIADVGCGTGALIERLQHLGYSNLSGVDISTACLELTTRRVGGVSVALHDVEHAPLPMQCDVIFMTGVLDFLANPDSALRHTRASLREGGLLLITIRNLLAYFPWYHLRFLANYVERCARLRHWFLHLTTPLGLRRNDQPFEHMYTPGEARQALQAAGFQVVREHADQILPMLWISGLPWLTSGTRWLDRSLGPAVPRWLKFRYVFVCRPT